MYNPVSSYWLCQGILMQLVHFCLYVNLDICYISTMLYFLKHFAHKLRACNVNHVLQACKIVYYVINRNIEKAYAKTTC